MVDGTYHHPEGYEQLLIIMYQDIITNEKIAGLYILMNKKNYIIYNKIFESLYNIISDNNQLNIHVKYIITDNESALIKGIKTIFPKIKNILCFYHF